MLPLLASPRPLSPPSLYRPLPMPLPLLLPPPPPPPQPTRGEVGADCSRAAVAWLCVEDGWGVELPSAVLVPPERTFMSFRRGTRSPCSEQMRCPGWSLRGGNSMYVQWRSLALLDPISHKYM